MRTVLIVAAVAVGILGILWWRNRQGAAAIASVDQVAGTGIPPAAGSTDWHPISGPMVAARSGRGHF
jgi:hypothetical protein